MKLLLTFGAGLAAALIVAALVLYTPDLSRASLEAKYRVGPQDYVSAAGIRLHVVDRGRGEHRS